jgi:hypothetical protein
MAARTAVAVDCSVPSATYPTIQSAVDDPVCDAVNIGSGTFYETISIERPVTLFGNGAGSTTIDGTAGGSVITVKTTAVTLRDLTIRNGSAQAGGGIYNEGTDLSIKECQIRNNFASSRGGGIFNKRGKLSISGSTIEENEGDPGGGLYNEAGTMEISNSMIKNNESDYHAGGLFNDHDSKAALKAVSMQDNSCTVDGGGLFNDGTMTIDDSSIHGNRSTNYSGGGIRNEGSLIINNSTISNNEDAHIGGGGISSCAGSLRLNNVTLSGNSGYPALVDCGSNIRIKNSIISDNPGKDCSGTVHSDGYNLVSDTSHCDYRSGSGDILNVPAKLGGLRGDPAFHPLRMGPGINSGNPDGCKNHLGQLLETDQRGRPRVGRCDMGAYEYQGEYHQSFVPLISNQFCSDFFDDFSDPNSGWPVGEDDYVFAAYNSGEYQVRSKSSRYLYLFGSPDCERDDFVTRVDARWEGKPGLAYGLIFDISGDFENYYLFAVNTEYQFFWLEYRSPGGWEMLIDPLETNIIHKDQDQNQLKVIRDGDKIGLEINGRIVREIWDGRISGPGGTGVFTVPYDDRAFSDARFDNFVSQALGNDGLSLPTARPYGFTLETRSSLSQELAPKP